MRGIFNYDGPVMVFLGKIADLILLNILTALCCIPIVTAGAAYTALYYMTIKMVKKEEGYIIRGFFKSFKDNFKQATLIWLGILAMIILLAGDYYILNYTEMNLPKALTVIICAAAILFFFMVSYVFPVLSRFENTVKSTVKNAFLMSVINFPKTILIIILNILPIVVFLYWPAVLPFVVMLGVALPAYVASMLFVGIFKKFEPEETKEENLGEDITL